MFELIHFVAVVTSLFFAPSALVFSYLLKRRFNNALLKWRKPQVVIFTIFAFILNLTLFVLACFFFACYQGRIVGIDLLQFSPAEMKLLGMDSMLLLLGVTQMHLAFQNMFTQFVTPDGIVLRRLSWSKRPFEVQVIPWWQIRDYYIHSDYPNTYFHFILQSSDVSYTRATLKVPFYVLSAFERVLEQNLNASRGKHNFAREIIKKTSKN